VSKTPAGHKATSLTIPHELYAWIKAEADREERSVTWMIRKAIREMKERG
jgi:hypothetical protein